MDHQNENLDIARKRYPDIRFEYIDLNIPVHEAAEKYDVITCFETLEHVGNLENATQNVLSFARKDSHHILISVPIEIGLIGVIKFIIKILYGYSLKELKNGTTFLSYFKSLLSNENISQYRDEREGWGTHFGFDYREFDEILNECKCKFEAKNLLSSRFYSITKCN
jgi:2-polyprenyl-3-methyl-5-hydroxy-6-metoxy-1,4-benzoquinol methylase